MHSSQSQGMTTSRGCLALSFFETTSMHLTNWWQRRRQFDGATYQARDVHHAIKVNGVLKQSTKQEGFIISSIN